MGRQSVPLFQYPNRSFVEDGFVLAVIGRCALVARLGFVGEEVRRVKVNFTFENVEGQDEDNSEASPFQLEEVELEKPFLITHDISIFVFFLC